MPTPLYLQPEAFVGGSAAVELVKAGRARSLGGGPLAFQAARLWRDVAAAPRAPALPLGALPGEDDVLALLDRLEASRPPFAGLALDRPRIMGIVNVTPDSFSDGGEHAEPTAAIAHGRDLRAAGADIIDIGGESTRPGSRPITAEEEMRRVLPVIEALAAEGALVSVDTRNAATMRAGLAAGARIVNDVSALTHDPAALEAVAAGGGAVVLMHMQGEPGTMQLAPRYRHAPSEVLDHLAARVAACERAGIPRARIAVDPGFGFGKTPTHNLEVLAATGLFRVLGTAVLVGVSRKSSLASMTGSTPAALPAKARLPASLALGLAALDRGADVLRVHDVAETRQAIAAREALLAL